MQTRRQYAVEHTAAERNLNRLAAEQGVSTKDLRVKTLPKTIQELRDDASSPAELQKIKNLENAARLEQQTQRRLVGSSEELGMAASRDVVRSERSTVIVGAEKAPGRADEIDVIGLSHDHTTLSFLEAKGGDAKLGFRTVDGVRVQQGTTAYLNELIHADVRLRAYLEAHPQLAHDIASGRVDLEYKLVKALPSGRVKVSEFVIDPRQLRLDDLTRVVAGGGG